ncbi:MAG: hypothetical protein ACQKBT_01395, partial [Puniceicoccales bacterium]
GSVETKGLVGEGYSLDFDNSNHAQQTVTNGGSDSIAINVTADGSGTLGADMTVRNGADIFSGSAFMGYEEGESNDITVSGSGTSWTNQKNIVVGYRGTGELIVEDGATVTANGVILGRDFGSVGHMTITGVDSMVDVLEMAVGIFGIGSLLIENGGRLEAAVLSVGRLAQPPITEHGTLVLDDGTVELTDALIADSDSITGSGTINATGLVGNGYSLVFDGTNSTSVVLDNGGVTLNITTGENSWFGASMEFLNGAVIEGTRAQLGQYSGDSTSILVSGAGTQWNLSSFNDIGEWGSGRVRVEDGGGITGGGGIKVGGNSTGNGLLEVVGSGSSIQSEAYVAVRLNGVLSVAGSATVRAADEVDVDGGGQLNVLVTGDDLVQAGTDGTGDFVNDGITRLVADPDLAAGNHDPISVGNTTGSITGSGSFEVFGGAFDSGTGVFSTSAPIDGAGGLSVIDLSGVRAFFDSGDLSVAFVSDAGIGSFDADRLFLGGIGGNPVLSAYSFTTDVSDVFLSFDIGAGFDYSQLAVFYRANASASWTEVDPEGAVYDGERFHFLADTFSDYAIVIPEPSQITLVIAALVAVITLLRRRVYD